MKKSSKRYSRRQVKTSNVIVTMTLTCVLIQAGDVREVRLVRNRQGRSKGFAYIEYTSEVITPRNAFYALFAKMVIVWFVVCVGNRQLLVLQC